MELDFCLEYALVVNLEYFGAKLSPFSADSGNVVKTSITLLSVKKLSLYADYPVNQWGCCT